MTLGDRIVVMSNGLIQQTGTPLDVYRHPANRFVAGFIGTPPMNFIDGTVVKGPGSGSSAGGSLHFHEQAPSGEGIRLGLTAEHAARLQAYEGKPIVAGIRPHAVSAALLEGRPDWAMSMRVSVVEPLGEAIDVTCRAASGRAFVARLPSNVTSTPGQATVLYADMSKVHFFEPGEFGVCVTG